MLEEPLQFTTDIVINLICRRGGQPHNTLAAAPTWYSDEAQRELDQQVNAALTEHGLQGPRGIDRGLLATVEAVAHPQLEYFGWFEGSYEEMSGSFAVLAGVRDSEAFVLLRSIDEGTVVLASDRAADLLDSFVNQLPPQPAGNGSPLRAGYQEVFGGGSDRAAGGGPLMEVSRPNATASPAEEMRRIVGLSRVGAAKLYAAARSSSGSRARVEEPLTVIDTAEGRWLLEKAPGQGRQDVVFTPATPPLLADRLRSAREAIAA